MNKHICHLNNQSKYVLGLSIDIVLLKTLKWLFTLYVQIRLILTIRKTIYHLEILAPTCINTEQKRKCYI